MPKLYDLIILGGGSGGSAAAKRAAGYGASVCLIERGMSRDALGNRVGAGVGGTCVNVGCVPKKLMFMAAQHREMFHGSAATGEGYGVTVGKVEFDWVGLKKRRDAYVKRLNGVYEGGWTKAGVDVKMGMATMTAPHTIKIALVGGGEEVIEAKNVLVATGGYPAVPDIPGSELGITSDSFFDLETQPKKCAVLGAGYIAVEMAGILHALGTQTDLLCRGASVLRRGFDPFIMETLAEAMKMHGPTLVPHSEVTKLFKEKDGTITLTLADGRTMGGYDCVLFAIGRTPATADLGLEGAGVKLNNKGQIIVDAQENTSAKNVFALGDVTQTGLELTPVAIAAGRRLADRLFGGCPEARIPYHTVPTVVFSHPPIGVVGLTQPEAEAHFGKANVTVKEAKFASMMYAFNKDENKVKTGLKLVLAGDNEQVVGLHIIGPFADEILQGFAVAVKMGATRADFENTMAIHPTTGEELLTFGGWGQKGGKPLMPRQLEPLLSAKPSASPAAVAVAPPGTNWALFAAGVLGGAAISAIALLQLKPRL